MKLFVATLAAETNTFSPVRTGMAAFEELGIRRGGESDADPASISLMLNAIKECAREDGVEVVEGIGAVANPLGPVVRSVYGALRDELLSGLQAALPVDGVILLLHGAMIAEGYDDCEGDIAARVRHAVGADTPIGAELDLHCHMTEAMAKNIDIPVAFKEYPHTDTAERAREVYRLTREAACDRIKPVVAVHDCRMVGLWPTTEEPIRAFVERLRDAEKEDGILSVSFGHSFPWGDTREAGAKIWVVADGDEAKAQALAGSLGKALWEIREQAALRPKTASEALDLLETTERTPLVIGDMADNPGGGAPGDSTFLLQALIERKISNVAVGCLWDPHAVAIARAAGENASLELRIGGKAGRASGAPLDAGVTVRRAVADHGQSVFGTYASFGASVWISLANDIDVVLVSQRQQTLDPAAFADLGLDLASKRGVIVKSAQHYRAGFASITDRLISVDAGGALNHDFAAIRYKKRDLNYWPRVENPFGGVA